MPSKRRQQRHATANDRPPIPKPKKKNPTGPYNPDRAAGQAARTNDNAPAKLQILTLPAYVPLLDSSKTYFGARGGRGSGKSHFFAESMTEECLIYPPSRCAGLRETQLSLDTSVKLLLQDKIFKFGAQSRFEIQDNQIHVLDGDLQRRGLIIFRGMQAYNAYTIKSLEGFNIGWFEEAQAASQNSIDWLYPTFRVKGAKLWFSWNPDQEDDPIEVFFAENKRDPDFVCVTTTYRDNAWLDEKSYRDMERDKRRDPDKYAHIWMGKYKKVSGERVFSNWRVAKTEAELRLCENPPADTVFYHGADWGYAKDPTVLIRCWEGPKPRQLIFDYEAYQVGCDLDDTPALFDTVPGARKWDIIADSSRPETIAHMKKHGYPKMLGSAKGAGSVEDGIEFLKNYDILVHPRCKHTIDELSFYAWKKHPKTNQILPILADKDNHVIDAARYSVERLRRARVGRIGDGLLKRAKNSVRGPGGRTAVMKVEPPTELIAAQRGALVTERIIERARALRRR